VTVARAQAANAITGARVVLTPWLVHEIVRGPAAGDWGAIALFAVIALTDCADGWVARRLGTGTRAGRWFDHGADICFVLSALSAYTIVGVAPWWVAAAAAGSFAAYLADPHGTPGGWDNRVGHAGGVLNYGAIGMLVADETAGLRVLPSAMRWLTFVAVAACALLAMWLRVVRWTGRHNAECRTSERCRTHQREH
jgi:phosphatidylglycerophosphate synthase